MLIIRKKKKKFSFVVCLLFYWREYPPVPSIDGDIIFPNENDIEKNPSNIQM